MLQACGSAPADLAVDERVDALAAAPSGPGYVLAAKIAIGATSVSQVWTFAGNPSLLVPRALDNVEGADGDSKATLTFKTAAGAVVCSYATPALIAGKTLRDLLPATRLNLVACSTAAKAGATLKGVASVTVTLRRGVSVTAMSTRIALPLAALRRNSVDDDVARPVVLFKHAKFPGELLIDASDGRSTYTVAEAGRSYASKAALVTDVARVFGGKVVKVNGQPSSVKISVGQLGKIRFVGKAGLVEPKVSDLLSVYLGGLPGIVTIAEKPLVVNEPIDLGTISQAFSTQPPPPASRDVCSGTMCTHNYSFHNGYLVYESIGGQTDITRGGYEEHGYLCWPSIVCTRRTGSSELSVSPTYFSGSPGGGFTRSREGAYDRSAMDVESVESKLWAVFGGLEFDSSGSVTGGEAGANVIAGAVQTGHLFYGHGATERKFVETGKGAPCLL